MFNTRKIITAALAAAIGVGVLSANAAPALAAGGPSASVVDVQFGIGHHRGREMRRDRSPRHEMRRGHGPRHGMRRGFTPRVCTNYEAVQKARSVGVRRAHVAWANHRAVKVNGRKFGRPISLTVGRAPFCPILRF